MPMYMHVSRVIRPPNATIEFWGPRGTSETQTGTGTFGIFMISPKEEYTISQKSEQENKIKTKPTNRQRRNGGDILSRTYIYQCILVLAASFTRQVI